VDTISDNAANAGIVMGGRPMRPDAVDLRWIVALQGTALQLRAAG